MSARKSLRERIIKSLAGWADSCDSVEYEVDHILRLFRDEQRMKCKKCLEQTVENIKAREMERMGIKK